MKSLLPFLSLFYIGFASAQTSCFDGADKLINGRCFTLVNQQLSRQDAHNWCRYRNPVTSSYLATVSDTTQSNFLASYARTTFNSNEGSFWIGLWRNTTGSRWQWDDGTPFGWSNFINSQYNYVAGTITNGKWTTYNPDNKLNFVCSYDPNGVPTPATGGTTAPPNWTTQSDPTWETPTMTPTGPSSCSQSFSSRTFLFAYSTDLLYDGRMEQGFHSIIYDVANSHVFTTYANVRFDMKIKENIAFHSDIDSFNAPINAHLPDSSLGNQDNSTGSDMFNILQEYVTKAPNLCGSIIYIAAKRYPDNVDGFDDLIAILRRNHVLVYIISSDTPSGGYNYQAMYNLTSKTNGLCIFDSDDHYAQTMNSLELNVIYNPFQVASKNAIVSGYGSVTVPIKVYNGTRLSDHQYICFSVVFMDHKYDNTFTHLNTTLSDSYGNIVGSDEWTYPHYYFKDQAVFDVFSLDVSTQYFYTVYYEYVNRVQELMEIRANSYDYVPDYWPPYDN